MNNIKYNVFISHITQEKEMAFIIKDLINEAFENKINIFVSSDNTSIPLGRDHNNVINEKLQESSAIIVVCSPNSSKSPWINIEFGAGWGQNIPVIPFCHSGIKPEQLHKPLSRHQGICGNNIEDLKKLIENIKNDSNLENKNIDIQKYINEIASYEMLNNINYVNNFIIQNFLDLNQILENKKQFVVYNFDSLMKDLIEEEISNIYIPEREGIHVSIFQIMKNFSELDIIKFKTTERYHESCLGEASSYEIIKGKYFFEALKVFNDYINKK